MAVEPLYLSWDDRGHIIIDEKPPNSTNRQVNLWQIRLYEPDEKVSLLVSNRDQGDVIDINNTLATLAPIENSNGLKIGIFGVPISSKRVIKVNDSYCVIKVDSYQLSAARERAFEWILFEIEFTNTKPSLDLADHK